MAVTYNLVMRCRPVIAFCFLLAGQSLTAQAPSLDGALKNFRAEVLNKRLIVQGFSDDPVAAFQWTGTVLSYTDPKLHTIGVMEPHSVELKANKLKISGERTTLVRDKDSSLKLDGAAHAEIVVDLQGGDAAQAILALKSELFFHTTQEGLAALPPGYASLLLQKDFRKEPKDFSPLTEGNHCPSKSQRFEPPTVTDTPSPEYSEEAKQARFSGSVMVMITVGVDGRGDNIWILRPAGHGLDQEAGKAASRYKFRPATCDGKPVNATIYIDVNFAVLGG